MTKETANNIVRGIQDKIDACTADKDDWAEFWGFTVGEYEDFLEASVNALERSRLIKCSERLPENEEHVLATDGEDWFIAWYQQSGSEIGWHDTDWGVNFIKPILAWRELPPAYREGSEDETANTKLRSGV